MIHSDLSCVAKKKKIHKRSPACLVVCFENMWMRMQSPPCDQTFQGFVEGAFA